MLLQRMMTKKGFEKSKGARGRFHGLAYHAVALNRHLLIPATMHGQKAPPRCWELISPQFATPEHLGGKREGGTFWDAWRLSSQNVSKNNLVGLDSGLLWSFFGGEVFSLLHVLDLML